MFLFPLIYVLSFFYGMAQLIARKLEGFLLFIIAGLPIYINSMSVTFMYGFSGLVPILQSFKEVIVLAACIVIATRTRKKIVLHKIDKWVLFFFILTACYIFIPLGSYSLSGRLLAFKNLSFFPILYFIGRLCNTNDFNFKKISVYIGVLGIITAMVVIGEKLIDTHLQSFTGYSEYLYYYFDMESSGNYGLTWTFETESQMKRFASIFANPLEHAAGAVLWLSVLLTTIAYKRDKRIIIQPEGFDLIGIAGSLICIVLAASRASFLSYFMLVYFYGWIIKNKSIVSGFHLFFLTALLYILFFLEGDLYDFIVNTITFENASSIGHVIEWLTGIEAMINNPMGMGLGESGRVAAAGGFNTGGENQFIIVGVQTGILSMLIYIIIYFSLINTGLKALKNHEGKTWKVSLLVILIKIGLFIPAFTANVDSYIYLTYFSWLISGYMVNLISEENLNKVTATQAV